MPGNKNLKLTNESNKIIESVYLLFITVHQLGWSTLNIILFNPYIVPIKYSTISDWKRKYNLPKVKSLKKKISSTKNPSPLILKYISHDKQLLPLISLKIINLNTMHFGLKLIP